MTDGPGAGCPKEMRYGPCGGVRQDLSCEVDRRPCPFVADARPTVPPDDVDEGSTATGGPGVDLPPVVVDVRYPRNAPPASEPSMRRWWADLARALHGCSALLGEHVDNPVASSDSTPLDQSSALAVLSSHGVPTVATVTGRDRTPGQAADVMRRRRRAGATAVHCVTGDHPAVLGLGRPARFGAEAITLLRAARDAQVPATVAESPSSPGDRIERLRWKQRSGAMAAILNHSGDPALVIEFALRCRDEGVDIPLIAPVPLVADIDTALALEAFPGLHLPEGFLGAVAASPDPLSTGLTRTLELTAELAASRLFAGVNLSGGTTSANPTDRLRLTEQFAPAVRIAWAAAG